MATNLPDGCTQEALDRYYYGGWPEDPEDPENTPRPVGPAVELEGFTDDPCPF